MRETILITGVAGFIGSSLLENLLKDGYKVIGIDNFNEYYPSERKRNNLKEAIKNSIEGQFELAEGDIRNQEWIEEILLARRPDAVVHLAACVGVRNSIEEPKMYIEVNVDGTLNILEAMKKSNCNRMIFASSSSVYGSSNKDVFQEIDRTDFPISPYALTKKAGELLCYTYAHLYSLKIACLRFFTVYGPKQRPDLAIYKFLDIMENSGEVPFFGDGSTKRDYTFIDDIVRGIRKSIDWTKKENSKIEIFNLGGNHTISLIEMVEILEKVTGKQAKLVRKPLEPGDMYKTAADISKATKVLEYQPSTDFESGIKKFYEWYQQEMADE